MTCSAKCEGRNIGIGDEYGVHACIYGRFMCVLLEDYIYNAQDMNFNNLLSSSGACRGVKCQVVFKLEVYIVHMNFTSTFDADEC